MPILMDTTSLTQRLGIFRSQTFTMLEDKLVLRMRGIGRSIEQSVPYVALSADPTRIRKVGFAWFVVAALALAGGGWFVWGGLHARPDDAGAFYAGAVFAWIVAIGTIEGGVRRTFDVIVFPISDGRIVLRSNRPDSASCREFVRALQEKITASRSIERRVIQQVLRVLRAEDFLDEWKYQKARERFDVVDDREAKA